MDEGLSLRKNDVRAMKTLLSSSKFSGRAAYGRYNSTYIRYCSFIASTNDSEILADDTGNRRYFVIPIIKADHNHTVNMYQLWAQALKMFNNGEQYWLTDEEVRMVNDINKEFEIENSVEYYISTYVEKAEDLIHDVHSSTEIRDHIIAETNRNLISEITIYRIGRTMKALGYKKTVVRQKDGLKKGFRCKLIPKSILVKEDKLFNLN